MESVDARPMSPIEIVPDDLLRSKPPTQEDSMREKNVDGDVRRKVGPYVLGKRLGAGGMGEVFRAFDERLERPVALKQIRPEGVTETRARRFKREARAAARLNHPGIVKLHDIFSEDGSDWIVMELVEGKTLAETLAAGPLSLEKAMDLALELAQALNAAHSEGIVHRDLKTKNVLVTSEGRIKILDFGLAKQVLFLDGQSTFMTADGQVVGTAHAMSPEQAMGRKVDLRSDLFSLGSLYYEMVTGVSPFKGGNPIETLRQICTLAPVPIRERTAEIPQSFVDLVDKLLEKEPAHRPRTTAEVVSELQRIAGLPIEDSSKTNALRETEDTGNLSEEYSARSGGERRQVTVMCCELVSKDSSKSLDPEDLYGAMVRFEELARKVIGRAEGHVANVMGHRLVAYFGYPRVHENDALRATYSAFQMMNERSSVNGDGDSCLTLRVGLFTGPAVIMNGPGQDQLVLGETLDMANLILGSADPGGVWAGSLTHQLIAKAYATSIVDVQEIGAESLKSESVFSIEEPQTGASTADVGLGFSLVARDRELDLLMNRFHRVLAGSGQVVLLSGEAGLGKSHLVQALKNRVFGEESETTWLSMWGTPFAQNSPFFPLAESLSRFLDVDYDDPIKSLKNLEDELSRYDLDLEQTLPLLASLLSLQVEERCPRLDSAPQEQRQKMLLAITSLFLKMASAGPTVMVVEDLHWLDPSTLEVLTHLTRRAVSCSLLLVLTYRPEFQDPWREQDNRTRLNLRRLTDEEVSVMVDRLTFGKPLPAEVVARIVKKADGVPLYIEQMTKSVMESGALVETANEYVLRESLQDFTVPATLRDLLTERLDRLGSAAKEVAQLAATVGRHFSWDLLAAVYPSDNPTLVAELARLVDAGIVYQKGFLKRRRYVFKHALIQDAAYESLMPRQRKDFHGSIGIALEESFPAIGRRQPELLAHHFTEAESFRSALGYWQQAGDFSLGRSAALEAASHYERGLKLISEIELGEERDKQEITMAMSLSSAYIITKGYSDPVVEGLHRRTYSLGSSLGDPRQLFWVLRGLWYYHFSRGEMSKAIEVTNQQLLLADDLETPHLIALHECRGCNYLCLGDISASRQEFEKGLALDSSDRDSAWTLMGGADPGVENYCNLSQALWLLGYPDQALKCVLKAVELSQRISDTPNSIHLAWAIPSVANIYHLRREAAETEKWSRDAILCCQEVGTPLWIARARVSLGSALVMNSCDGSDKRDPGIESRGLDQIEKGVESWRAMDTDIGLSSLLSHLAQSYLDLGEVDRANEILGEATSLMEKTGEQWWKPEVYRLTGEVARQLAGSRRDQETAEKWFERAIDIAGLQGQKSLELRARISLSRLFLKEGSKTRARDSLCDIYAWFTEGFSTGDLEDARRILSQVC